MYLCYIQQRECVNIHQLTQMEWSLLFTQLSENNNGNLYFYMCREGELTLLAQPQKYALHILRWERHCSSILVPYINIIHNLFWNLRIIEVFVMALLQFYLLFLAESGQNLWVVYLIQLQIFHPQPEGGNCSREIFSICQTLPYSLLRNHVDNVVQTIQLMHSQSRGSD